MYGDYKPFQTADFKHTATYVSYEIYKCIYCTHLTLYVCYIP